MRVRKPAARLAILAVLAGMAGGCKSHHVEIALENRTGGAIRLVEVDYPTASFGENAMAAGAKVHYRIQVQGSGPVKVTYAAGNGSQTTEIGGPALSEGQEGRLEIVLLPGGKAEFHPQLTEH
jgi:hypothetical protein